MERQDSQGLTRKRAKLRLGMWGFYIIKFVLMALIITAYFVYSKALLPLLLVYAGTFFLSFTAEKNMNRSYLKKNYIKLPKFDNALALIIVIAAVTAVSAGISTTSVSDQDFMFTRLIEQGKYEEAEEYLENKANTQSLTDCFTLLTGERDMLSRSRVNKFGLGVPPDGFKPPENNGGERPSGTPPTLPDDFDFESFRGEHFGGGDFKMKFGDLPVNYIFTSLLSTIASAIILFVPLTGLLQMYSVYAVKRRQDKRNESPIIVSSSLYIDEKELDRLLEYGELYEDK